MVEAQRRALAAIGIPRVAVAIGGSLGGQQALQWARGYDDAVEHAIVVGTYDHLRAQGIAQNFAAREAIRLDAAFAGGWYEDPPADGLRLARAIATLTYKSEALFEKRFANRPDRAGGDPSRSHDGRFDVEGYLAHQGDVFVRRFDANTYLVLTRAMDLFDLRGRERPAGRTRLTFVGIEGDQLYAPELVRACAGALERRRMDDGLSPPRERPRTRRVSRRAGEPRRGAARHGTCANRGRHAKVLGPMFALCIMTTTITTTTTLGEGRSRSTSA